MFRRFQTATCSVCARVAVSRSIYNGFPCQSYQPHQEAGPAYLFKIGEGELIPQFLVMLRGGHWDVSDDCEEDNEYDPPPTKGYSHFRLGEDEQLVMIKVEKEGY
jgi:hypothetical protein